MNKRLQIILCIWMSINSVSYAQKGLYVEFGGGMGSSLLDYSLYHKDYKSTLSSGLNEVVGVGLNYRFTERWGIGLGLDYTNNVSNMQVSGTQEWKQVIDSDPEIYNHRLQVEDWKEAMRMQYLEIPIWLEYSVPIITFINLNLRVGAKYGIIQKSSYSGRGALTHTGYYPQWNLTIHDIEAEGFYSTKSFNPEGALSIKNTLSTYTELGLQFRITRKTVLLLTAYYNYGLTKGLLERGSEDIGFRNDRAGMEKYHYFMSPYAPLSQTKGAQVSHSYLSSQGIRARIIIQLTDFRPIDKCHCILTRRTKGRYRRPRY